MFKTFPFQHQIATCYMYIYIYICNICYMYICNRCYTPITISFLKQSCHVKHISGGSGSRRAGHEVASLKLFCWPNLSWTLTILQTSTISKKINQWRHALTLYQWDTNMKYNKIQSMHGNLTSWRKYTWRSNRFLGRVHHRSSSDRDSATSAERLVEIEGAQFGNPPGTRWWNFGQWRLRWFKLSIYYFTSLNRISQIGFQQRKTFA